MKKYTMLMGILLALVMLAALMPMTAMADNQTYPPDTNPPTDNVSVDVIKRAYGLDKTKKYTFNFEYYQVEDEHGTKPIEGGVNGKFSITVEWDGNEGYHLGSHTIEKLKPNIWIAIEEINPVIPEGYRLVFTSGIVKIHTDPLASDKHFDNTYEERKDCDVVISKAVEGYNANANDEFKFEVTFYPNPSRPPIAYSANAAAPVRVPPAIGNAKPKIYKTLANGSTQNFTDEEIDRNFPIDNNGKVTGHFTLKHGESLTILNAAAKKKPITVKELDSKGYLTTVNYYGGSAIITNTAASAGLPQTGDAQMPYIGAGLVLAAMAIVVIIAGKKRN